MRPTLALACLFLLLVACQSGAAPGPQPSGVVQPTVAGVQPPCFSCIDEGREAFTRVCGSVTALLEDASWLAFEGEPSSVERNHRSYFQYGYTTFQVELRSLEFTQPTGEAFVLEDSLGRRIPGSPLSYCGSPVLVDDRYFSQFELSFQHTVSRDVAWIRLTRVADGSSVEWLFGHAQQAQAPCAPAPRAPAPCPPAPCAPPTPGR